LLLRADVQEELKDMRAVLEKVLFEIIDQLVTSLPDFLGNKALRPESGNSKTNSLGMVEDRKQQDSRWPRQKQHQTSASLNFLGLVADPGSRNRKRVSDALL
jgi:hypothetical protein